MTPKDQLDVSKIFLAYLSCGGDAVQTASVAEVELDDVLSLARSEMWDLKIQQRALSPAKNKDDAASRAREINRMACYVQALRIRGLIDETIHHLYDNGTAALESFCTEERRDGTSFFTTKPLLDLTKAAEAAHAMLYRALGDVVAKDDGASTGLKNLTALHMTVVGHMQNAGAEGLRAAEPALKAAEKTFNLDAPRSVIGYLDDEPTTTPAQKS